MNSDAIRILLIEDNPGDARLIQEMLHEVRGMTFSLERADRLSTGLERLAEGDIGVLLLDLGLPDSQGLDTLGRVQAQAGGVPIVVLTGLDDEAVAVRAVQRGAQDYLIKGQMDGNLLVRAIRYAIERQHMWIELQSSEDRLRTIIEENADGILVVDRDGIVRFVNPAAESLFGCPADELVGETFGFPLAVGETTEIAAESVAGATDSAEFAAGAKDSDRSESLAEFGLRSGGETIAVEMHVVETVWDGESAYLASLRDITERKQRQREREAITTVASAMRTTGSRAELLPVILDQLLALLNADGAALAIRDPASGDTVFELARGDWANWTGVRLAPGEGVSGRVIATGQPYLSNDVRASPRIAQPGPSASSGQALISDLCAQVCVPLIAQKQTIGALWVGRQTAIADEEVRLLTAIADMAANAIHRATLHEQTEQRLQRLTALRNIDIAITASLDLRVTLNLLLDQVTASGVNSPQLGVDAADVLLFDSQTQTLEYAVGRGFRSTAIQRSRVRLGQGLAGRAALERRLISTSDFPQSEIGVSEVAKSEGFVAYYGVPLMAKGQVKGVLEVFHRTPLTPDPEWRDFLETMASQAAIAIDNATLFDDLQRSNAELTLAYDTTLEGWARALELRDVETEGHSRRVTEMTERLARAMGMSEAELVHVRRGTLLHDIGKMGVPDSILHKPGSLTEEEWEVMRQHPAYARELLSPIAHLRPALDIPYYHHEKWDGTGYPRGLRGEEIPLAARVFAVVDVWDALHSERPYRPAWPEEKVREHIQQQAGKHFDPRGVEVFLKLEMEGTR